MNTINIYGDFDSDFIDVRQKIPLYTGDFNTTRIYFPCYERWDSNATYIFEMKDSKGNLVMLSDIDIDSGYLMLTGTNEQGEDCSIFKYGGKYPFELSMYKDGGKITSRSGTLLVEQQAIDDDTVIVSPYLPIFEQLMAEIGNIKIESETEGNRVKVTITGKNKVQKVYYLENGQDGVLKVTMNGVDYTPVNGSINLGTVIQDDSGKVDKTSNIGDSTLEFKSIDSNSSNSSTDEFDIILKKGDNETSVVLGDAGNGRLAGFMCDDKFFGIDSLDGNAKPMFDNDKVLLESDKRWAKVADKTISANGSIVNFNLLKPVSEFYCLITAKTTSGNGKLDFYINDTLLIHKNGIFNGGSLTYTSIRGELCGKWVCDLSSAIDNDSGTVSRDNSRTLTQFATSIKVQSDATLDSETLKIEVWGR